MFDYFLHIYREEIYSCLYEWLHFICRTCFPKNTQKRKKNWTTYGICNNNYNNNNNNNNNYWNSKRKLSICRTFARFLAKFYLTFIGFTNYLLMSIYKRIVTTNTCVLNYKCLNAGVCMYIHIYGCLGICNTYAVTF